METYWCTNGFCSLSVTCRLNKILDYDWVAKNLGTDAVKARGEVVDTNGNKHFIGIAIQNDDGTCNCYEKIAESNK